MPKRRWLTFAMLAASAAVGAYPRSDLPSISFVQKDWELACDNTRTCRATGHHAEDDGQRGQATRHAETRDLMTALRTTVKDESCELVEPKSEEPDKLTVRRLTKDKLLVSHACWMAAYNSGDGYWAVDAKPPYSAVLVTTSATNYTDGVIWSTQKGSGIAGCFSSASWTWDGLSFAQHQRRRPECAARSLPAAPGIYRPSSPRCTRHTECFT